MATLNTGTDRDRQDFEECFDEQGGFATRMHQSYPADYIERAEKEAAWWGFQAALRIAAKRRANERVMYYCEVEKATGDLDESQGVYMNCPTEAREGREWLPLILRDPEARVQGETLSAPEYDAAKRTLLDLGYTYHGGERWKPPIGKPPSWLTDDDDELPPPLPEIFINWLPKTSDYQLSQEDVRAYGRLAIAQYRVRHDRVTQSDLDQCRKAIEALQRADETLQAHPPGALLFATSVKQGSTVALGSVEATADCARFKLAADPLFDVVIAGRWCVVLKINHEAGVTKVQAFREEGT